MIVLGVVFMLFVVFVGGRAIESSRTWETDTSIRRVMHQHGSGDVRGTEPEQIRGWLQTKPEAVAPLATACSMERAKADIGWHGSFDAGVCRVVDEMAPGAWRAVLLGPFREK